MREGHLDRAETESKANKKNMQRGKTSRSKFTSGAHKEINDSLFDALGREAPKNREAAEEMMRSIIHTQKNTLEVRLPFTLPSLWAFIRVCLDLYDSLTDPRGFESGS